MDYKKDIEHKGLLAQQAAGGMEAFTITLSKKCERLATAVYLVTNFLLDTEPLKTRLRTLSLDFVRDASFARVGGHTTEGHSLDVLRGNILETLALLELAFISGLLSEMNFTILKREYASLRDAIEIKKASHESRTDNILGETFFGSTFRGEDTSHKDILNKGQNNQNMSLTMSDRNASTHSNVAKLIAQKTTQPTSNGSHQISSSASLNIGRETRRAQIIKIVKDSHDVMIKDIALHFPDLSEKTLQRELIGLVETGVLKKTGERRWSRYSIV